jgi:hypothetical protein
MSDDMDDELAEFDADTELTDEEWQGHTLSIRSATGEELVSISSVNSGHEWSVHMQPGGEISNAYLGARDDSPVWVDTGGRRIERDDDGTYVIQLG